MSLSGFFLRNPFGEFGFSKSVIRRFLVVFSCLEIYLNFNSFSNDNGSYLYMLPIDNGVI